MMVRARGRWPVVLGAVSAVAALVAFGLGGLGEIGSFAGVSGWGWALAAALVATGFGAQLLLAGRASLHRERRLVVSAALLRQTSADLEQLARTDALTGLANRRASLELLGAEFRRGRRYGRSLSVLMLDLDHFKRMNDAHGHPFGDYVLAETAQSLVTSVRESDRVARLGGEEFVITLPETTEAEALVVAEKLREAVAALEFRQGDVTERMTVSIGVAAADPTLDEDEASLLGRADAALYRAKAEGRDCVVADSSSRSGSQAGSGFQAGSGSRRDAGATGA